MIHSVPQVFTPSWATNGWFPGPPAEVALAVLKGVQEPATKPIVIFDDANGRPIDLDLRGTERDIVARLPQPASNPKQACR